LLQCHGLFFGCRLVNLEFFGHTRSACYRRRSPPNDKGRPSLDHQSVIERRNSEKAR
jgi:hypothetical protein